MQSTQTLDACLTRLEREVAEAVTVTNGTCAQASHAVVQLAVRRARTKARMLGGLDSGVALSALQSLQEASCEVRRLPEVTEANAALMQQLSGNKDIGAHEEPSEERGFSIKTQAGEAELSGAEGQGEQGEQGEGVLVAGAGTNAPDASSVMSTITGGITGGSVSDSQGELESTAGSVDAAALAADVCQPLRQLVQEVQASKVSVDPAAEEFKRRLRLRQDRPAEIRMAREVDFEHCSSPRERETPPGGRIATVRGSCLAYGIDEGGKAKRVEPLDPSVDQFHAMSPMLSAARSGRVAFLPGSHGASDDEGGHGRVVILKGEAAPRQQKDATSSPKRFDRTRSGRSSSSTSPRGSFEAVRKGAMLLLSPQTPAGGGTVCDAVVPPGLNPSALVEGTVVDHEGEHGRGVEGAFQDRGEEEMTPPRAELDELAADVGRRLAV